MGEIFTFFKNATKALFLSPFYLLYFCVLILKSFALFFIGEFHTFIGIFKHKSYDKPSHNIYERRLKLCKEKNATFDVLKELNRRNSL